MVTADCAEDRESTPARGKGGDNAVLGSASVVVAGLAAAAAAVDTGPPSDPHPAVPLPLVSDATAACIFFPTLAPFRRDGRGGNDDAVEVAVAVVLSLVVEAGRFVVYCNA